ncbi:MAG: cation-translocating P-type ATPase [bacterium]|nr:cation-translocating P-type ATPase [bacterium]
MHKWWAMKAPKSEGLTTEEVEKARLQHGPNSFPTARATPIYKQIIEAFTDPLELLLLGAGFISLFVGEATNFIWILAIVIFMAAIKLITDFQAQKALSHLKKFQEVYCRVIRDGLQITVPVGELVPGDLLFLSEGDQVGADARIIREVGAYTNDLVLSGESLPVKKTAEIMPEDTVLAERKNMVYRGTFVTGGTIHAVVMATGINTEMGKIARDVTSAEVNLTPLQIQLEKLGKNISIITIILCLLIISIYIWRGMPLISALITAVSLAIAFIPEALGAIMVVALALGVKEMVKEKAVVKKLHAAEALGSVSVICTDKTGTITLGQMKATHVWTVDDTKETYNKILEVILDCNNFIGPTEKALAELLVNNKPHERVSEIPFSSAHKFMQTVVKINGKLITNIKGAPEVVFNKCKNADKKILAKAHEFEEKGYRVLGFAQNGTFLGLVALSDPPRPEVFSTVENLIAAGIDPKMITGDSPVIALTIAKQTGIVDEKATMSDVLFGHDLQNVLYLAQNGDVPSQRKIFETAVFARVEPKDKVVIIKVLQMQGLMVAMTGDGINDCPGLVAADIGVAVGTGTDLAKDVADVVLLGAYEAILGAVRMGRLILHRARLYIHALLSTNGAEVGIFMFAAVLGLPMPLTAVQLLVINLLGDSWLSMALAVEPAQKDLMRHPPRKATDGVITGYMWFSIGLQSLVATILIAGAFYVTRSSTVVFLLFMTQKIIRSAFTARSFTRTIWELGFFTNKWSLAAAALSAAIAGIAVYFPPLGMKPVTIDLLLIILGLGLIPAITEESVKIIRKHYV